jgi:selenophosphate synthase
MAYLQTHFWPGGTEEQYRATVKVVHPESGLPEGQRSHTAGPTEGGYLIAVLWDSKERSDAFIQDVLMAAMPVEGGFAGQPDERAAEVVHHDAI